jgi:hypothetical protein
VKKSHLAYLPTIVLGDDLSTGQPFTLAGWPLKQHKCVTGITGQGKSKFLGSVGVQLLREKIPFAIVDPHSDLCDDVFTTLAQTGFFADKRGYDRLWYIQFSEKERHIPFNVLKQPYPTHQIASNTLEAWKRAWSSIGDGNAVNLENVLLAALVALIENHKPLTELSRFLQDDNYRALLTRNVSDPNVQEFFALRFQGKKTASLSESTLRRAFLLTFSSVLRHCLGASENALDFRFIMDNKISVLFDLGNLDPQTQRFLGCLITIGFEEAALSRANMPEEKRTPYHLFLDEFSQYTAQSGEALERMLTLTRKFGLSLVLACQTLHQTGDIKDALQNCLPITFKMGHEDAHQLATRFFDATTEQQGFSALFSSTKPLVKDGQNRNEWTQVIKNLSPQECLVHLGGKTFKLHTLTMPTVKQGELKKIKETYAQQLLVANTQETKPAHALSLVKPTEPGGVLPLHKPSPRRRVKVEE